MESAMESIYQSIELLSKEKGIETQIVLDAVKHALLVVARKHYRTNEHYIAELNEKTGSTRPRYKTQNFLPIMQRILSRAPRPARLWRVGKGRGRPA